MDEFERELARTLARVEAPRGFAERVGALGTEERPAGKILAWPLRTRWVRGALAAGLVLGASVGEGWQMHRTAQRRRAAEAEFAVAMRVTNRALAQTRDQLSRAGVRLSE